MTFEMVSKPGMNVARRQPLAPLPLQLVQERYVKYQNALRSYHASSPPNNKSSSKVRKLSHSSCPSEHIPIEQRAFSPSHSWSEDGTFERDGQCQADNSALSESGSTTSSPTSSSLLHCKAQLPVDKELRRSASTLESVSLPPELPKRRNRSASPRDKASFSLRRKILDSPKRRLEADVFTPSEITDRGTLETRVSCESYFGIPQSCSSEHTAMPFYIYFDPADLQHDEAIALLPASSPDATASEKENTWNLEIGDSSSL